MKKLLTLAALAAAGWYGFQWLKGNKTVQQIQQAPVQYTQNLQHDVTRAQDAAQVANQIIHKELKDVEKDVQQQDGGQQ